MFLSYTADVYVCQAGVVDSWHSSSAGRSESHITIQQAFFGAYPGSGLTSLTGAPGSTGGSDRAFGARDT